MPRPLATLGGPAWVDLLTSDLAGSEAFYTALFGWTAEHGDEEAYGGYTLFAKDGHAVAGGMRNDPSQQMPDVWGVYLSSADAAATVESATARGAKVLLPVMDVPEEGKVAVVTDAGGAAVGVWQATGDRGIETVAEPGTPGWFELNARDFDASVAFYENVFGWQTSVMSDSGDFRYTTLGKDETAQAGIMDASGFLPEGVPAHWSVYWVVEDTDAAVAHAQELGGTLEIGPDDTPFGRMAALVDPTGARFKVIQSQQG